MSSNLEKTGFEPTCICGHEKARHEDPAYFGGHCSECHQVPGHERHCPAYVALLHSELVERLGAATEAYEVRALGFGGCPCFIVATHEFMARGHCWRVSCSKPGRNRAGYCCVHVQGDRALGKRLKGLLDAANWYGPWQLHFGADCR